MSHGIAVALFALRSEKSGGIGEFLDLIPLIDWLASINFTFIQLLPLNQMGPDNSPYNGLSSCALDPIYLNLNALEGFSAYPELMEGLHKLQKYNYTPFVDYQAVRKTKEALLRRYFELYNPPITLQEPWATTYSTYQTEHPPSFSLWCQQEAQRQMHEVKLHATKKGVQLMGDLPILVSPTSIDCQAYPHYFDFSFEVGAPPDMYNREGQHWGFPIYNDTEVEKSHFSLWKQRLQAAEPLYHLYRIDHIAGLFRLWAIPKGKKPTEGHFEPKDSSQWQAKGEKILQFLKENSPLIPVGEDLGNVPDFVRHVMDKYQIARTKVVRWERAWAGDGHFIPYAHYLKNSLTTVSTHDSEPVRLWWRNHPEEAKAFAHFKGWSYQPYLSDTELLIILQDSHTTPSRYHINMLQEYLMIFDNLRYPDAAQERINIPGTVNDTNWRYRYRPFIEAFTAHQGLTQTMKQIATR